MQLLPLSYIKDAARSVKRICEEMFKETDSSVFIELLGIQDLTVTMFCLRKEGDQEVLHLQCAHRDDVAICPHCDTISENIHEAKKRCVRHLDIWGKKTFLHFFSCRFMCECCKKPFTESLSFVEKFRRHTSAFERYIYEQCTTGTRKKVAQNEGLSQATVKEILNRLARRGAKKPVDIFTRVLGIDEISLKKRYKQFALVISDISSKAVLAVLPDRHKETFRNIFEKVRSRERVSKFLKAWSYKARLTGNTFLLKFVGTLTNWWHEILNYFIERVTNGFVERINNSIRNIIRSAFGYRNFENFRLRVFAEHGFPTHLR